MNKQVQLLRISEVAKILRVSSVTVRRWSRTGKISFVVINTRGDRRYRLTDIESLIKKGDETVADKTYSEDVLAEFEANQLENDDARMKASFKKERDSS